MTHPRSQIRNAIVAHLFDATAAEERVFAGRLMPIEEPDLPALVVHTRDDAGAATWTVAVTADTTNGGIKVEVTGAASTTIRWVCKIETTEMTF